MVGFWPTKVVPRWSDLVPPGPECHSPSWDGAASLLAFPQFEKKKSHSLWSGLGVWRNLRPHLFQPKCLVFSYSFWPLTPHKHHLREYTGNYSDYLEQYLAEQDKQWAAYRDQNAEIRRMKQDIIRVKARASYTERQVSSVSIGGGDIKQSKDFYQGIAKKVARKAKSREKKLDRYLDSDERVEKPARSWQMKLSFDEASHLGRDVLALEGLSVGYPGGAPLLTDLNQYVQAGQRVVLTGENGCGKTTLLRTIAGQIAPLAGRARLGGSVQLGYMAQEQELLDPEKSALETILGVAALNQTEARSFLHQFLFSGDDPLRPTGQLSYGERSRLALACLVAQGCNFLLLDEPINHLDIPSRTQFEEALRQFQGTVLAVVHDRYFIERFAEEVWVVENGRLHITLA
ncbi:MAG: ABC-F family ATP-binding cassette domain-containing protein [Chloroflexi bacterium]|nr:ABC-F family ATP-binding cassette domain-containing protein [Chloroflexota bacterium]